jgi:hypothetical protein
MARLDKTLADYIAIAISPVLIMLMVGSLLYFLVAVGGVGSYWVLGWFTMAIVLIARISMDEETHERAIIYGGLLALAVWTVLGGGLATVILLGLAWWAAHQLTWDCTLIDEDQDSSGRGLFEIVRRRRRKKPADAVDADNNKDAEPEGVTARVDEMRAEAHPRRSPKKKPHAPGVWILYFSLAALPVFGLGQGFVPAGDVERRRWTFELFCVYVASGLSLLVTTSFLGLRRYLRQRGVTMPVDVAGVWVTLGAAMIVVLLFVAALLPRPAAEYAISQFPVHFSLPPQPSTSQPFGDQKAGENPSEDQRGVEGREEQGAPSQTASPEASQRPGESGQSPSGEQAGKQPGGDSGKGAGQEPGQKSSKEPGKEPGEEPGRESGQESSQNPPEKSGADKLGEQPPAEREDDRKGTARPSSREQSAEPSNRGDSRPDESQPDGRRRESSTPAAQGSQAARDVRPREPSEEKSAAPPAKKRVSSARPSPKPRSPRIRLPQVSLSIGGFLKLILYAVVLGAVGYWAWKNWDRVRAAIQRFVRELREFWARLFGRKDQGAWELVEDEASKQPRLRPFSDYADPFASGLARRSPPEQVVRYTFEALEAWARENGCARDPDQTPREFARQIARHEASLSPGAKTLASLYSHVAYASGRPTAESIRPLAEFWQRLRVAEIPRAPSPSPLAAAAATPKSPLPPGEG